MNISRLFIISAVAVACLSSCGGKTSNPPFQLGGENKPGFLIPYEEIGGVKTIPVKLNGVTMNMIYDTGCSGIHMSLNEVQTLLKNGKLTEEDILGCTTSQIADGSSVENVIINIRRIEIGDENGLALEDVPASVSLNQVAPLLLGNSVLDELASVEVDNISKTIKFNKR